MKTLEYHTIQDWDKPRSGMFTIIKDAWWCVNENGDPLFYSKHNHPQCNDNYEIMKRIHKHHNIKQIQLVYIPLRIQDYIN